MSLLSIQDLSPVQWIVRLGVLALSMHLLFKLVRRGRRKSLINNLPGPKSSSWIIGNLLEIHEPKNIRWHQEAIEKYGRVIKVYGVMNEEQFFVADARALHNVIVKDQHIFVQPDMMIGLNQIMFGKALPAMEGPEHAKQRKLMNPVFSVANVRTLTPIFYDLSSQLCDILEASISSGKDEVDMFDWISRMALESVGQAGYGYSFRAFDKGYKDALNDALNDFVPSLSSVMPLALFFPSYKKYGPAWLQRLVVNILPIKPMHRIRDISWTLDKHARDIVKQRRDAIAAGDETMLKKDPGMGKDLVSVLMRANMAAEEQDRLADDEIVGQISLLSFAAQDTTTSALCRILHYMAMRRDVQERLREEIRNSESKYGTELPYDELMGLPYLDAIVRETLRLHPPLAFMYRTAREATVLPLSEPIVGTDGKLIHEVPIAKNQSIIVSMEAPNRDPAIWGPDASEWKPERWLEASPEKPESGNASAHRLPAIYSGIMTFIGGPRACLGFRFALLEMKVVISTLIDKFSLEIPPDREITWMMYSIKKPVFKIGDKETQGLPMRIRLLV